MASFEIDGQWSHKITQTLQDVGSVPSYSSEFIHKALLLKTPNSWVTENAEIKVVIRWKIHSNLFIVLKSIYAFPEEEENVNDTYL